MKDKTIYKSTASGKLSIISSKSFIHRALIAGSLCEQSSMISNVTYNDDIVRTVQGLNNLGANIIMNDDYIIINPITRRQLDKHINIDANESGSTLRFLIPLASFLYDNVTFSGSKRLLERPQTVYEKIYSKPGVKFVQTKDRISISKFPVVSEYHVAGNVSSQFITGLMFTLPLLSQSSKIVLTSKLESKPYVNMTIQILRFYNIIIEETSYGYYVKGNQTYVARDLVAEGDFSQSAFFAVLGAINNDVTIENLNFDSSQGDKEIFDILQKVGIKLTISNNSVTVHKGELKSSVIDLKHIPDLGPILFVMALFSNEKIKFINIERLRIKESDRVESMCMELRKFGAKIEINEYSMIVHRLEKFNKVDSVFAHNDHRVAMSLSVLATMLEYPLLIEDSKSVMKSYPDFFYQLKKLNIKMD